MEVLANLLKRDLEEFDEAFEAFEELEAFEAFEALEEEELEAEAATATVEFLLTLISSSVLWRDSLRLAILAERDSETLAGWRPALSTTAEAAEFPVEAATGCSLGLASSNFLRSTSIWSTLLVSSSSVMMVPYFLRKIHIFLFQLLEKFLLS